MLAFSRTFITTNALTLFLVASALGVATAQDPKKFKDKLPEGCVEGQVAI